MNQADEGLLRSLLTETKVLSLGVLVDGQPYVGLVPFAVRPDFSALIVHASGLAIHSRGLTPGAPFGILIHTPETQHQNPLELPRLSLQGVVRVPSRGTNAEIEASRAYIDKFPESEMTFQLGDFQIYELEVRRGRLIAGFARTVNLNPDHLHSLAPRESQPTR